MMAVHRFATVFGKGLKTESEFSTYIKHDAIIGVRPANPCDPELVIMLGPNPDQWLRFDNSLPANSAAIDAWYRLSIGER